MRALPAIIVSAFVWFAVLPAGPASAASTPVTITIVPAPVTTAGGPGILVTTVRFGNVITVSAL